MSFHVCCSLPLQTSTLFPPFSLVFLFFFFLGFENKRTGNLNPKARVFIFDKFNNDEAEKQDMSFWEDILAGVCGDVAHVNRKHKQMGALSSKVSFIFSNHPLEEICKWFPEKHPQVADAFRERIVGGDIKKDENLFSLINLFYKKYLGADGPPVVDTIRQKGFTYRKRAD